MNVERIEKLAELLYSAVPEANFHMSKWFGRYDIDKYKESNVMDFDSEMPSIYSDNFIAYECGTTCCIAGWAIAMANDFKPLNLVDTKDSFSSLAASYLEINKDQSYYIFYSDDSSVWNDVFNDYEEIEWDPDMCWYVGITPKIASDVLYRIANGDIKKFNEMEENYNDTYSFAN
jgi:hypothetical protein